MISCMLAFNTMPLSPPPCRQRTLRQGALAQPVVMVDELMTCTQKLTTNNNNCWVI